MENTLYPIKKDTDMLNLLSEKFEFSTARHESITFEKHHTKNFISTEYNNPLLSKVLIVDDNIIHKLAFTKNATIEVLEIFIENLSNIEVYPDIVDKYKKSFEFAGNFEKYDNIYKYFNKFLIKDKIINLFFKNFENKITIQNLLSLENEFKKHLIEIQHLDTKNIYLYMEFFTDMSLFLLKPYIDNFLEKFSNDNRLFKSYNILFTKNDIDKSKKILPYNNVVNLFLLHMEKYKILFNKIDSNNMLYSIDTKKIHQKDGNININYLLENIEKKRKSYKINTLILGKLSFSQSDFKILFDYANYNNINIISNEMIINFQKLNKLNVFMNSLLKFKGMEKGKNIKNYFTKNDKIYSFDLLKINDFSIQNLSRSILGT